ncbi:hypothetical protein ELE36_17550 [Pseudolysobacter antarcticus]|uniref:DUF2306 domain-containing protein n=1 Tax=Pseudolysobacter antarcticus TaxID=2511995 RepID=A0A411HNH8_9GAMM|nr:hypothetical protein [Pseudolysobacter antarcticus]QBB72022.1 hypothetical protein ELE36_17550 [Pseudolysobacter antarcticus]
MINALGLFTAFHTAISILAILAGVFAIRALLGASVTRAWTSWFLYLAVATSVTGFFFPFHGMTPAIAVGIIALLVLAAVFIADRSSPRSRVGRWVYAGGIVISEYFLVFVLVAQGFAKIPLLHAAAPTQQEPPFAIAQLAVLALFIVLGILALRRSR